MRHFDEIEATVIFDRGIVTLVIEGRQKTYTDTANAASDYWEYLTLAVEGENVTRSWQGWQPSSNIDLRGGRSAFGVTQINKMRRSYSQLEFLCEIMRLQLRDQMACGGGYALVSNRSEYLWRWYQKFDDIYDDIDFDRYTHVMEIK